MYYLILFPLGWWPIDQTSKTEALFLHCLAWPRCAPAPLLHGQVQSACEEGGPGQPSSSGGPLQVCVRGWEYVTMCQWAKDYEITGNVLSCVDRYNQFYVFCSMCSFIVLVWAELAHSLLSMQWCSDSRRKMILISTTLWLRWGPNELSWSRTR